MSLLKTILRTGLLLMATQAFASSTFFNAKDRVMNLYGFEGTVVGAPNSNGDFYVRYDYDPLLLIKVSSSSDDQLAKISGCTDDKYCVGDGVFGSNGFSGKVVGILPNGKVDVQFNGIFGCAPVSTRNLAKNEGDNMSASSLKNAARPSHVTVANVASSAGIFSSFVTASVVPKHYANPEVSLLQDKKVYLNNYVSDKTLVQHQGVNGAAAQ